MNAEGLRGESAPGVRRALGIDLGDVRIGVALSDGLGMLAHPCETIQVGSGQPQPPQGSAKSKKAGAVTQGKPGGKQPSGPMAAIVVSAKGVNRVAEIAVREKVGIIIVGLPRNMDGTDGPAAAKARAFAEALRSQTACEVRLLDERLTTVAAQKALHASGRNTKDSRQIIDQVAAQMILQTYLDGEALKQPDL